jgi:ESCRT-II complex subunit VPS36
MMLWYDLSFRQESYKTNNDTKKHIISVSFVLHLESQCSKTMAATGSSSIEPGFSPMMCLPKATLTASGLLQLDAHDGEVELMRRSGMELRHENGPNGETMAPPPPGEFYSSWVDRNLNLTVTLTTHRVVFMTTNHHEARFLHLLNVQHAQASGGANLMHWNASYKLVLNTYAFGGELVLVFRSTKTSPQKDRDDMLQLILKALERRAWEVASRLEEKKKTSTSNEVAKRKVGVDAIMAKNALRHKEAARLADEALSGDAEQLLREAAELISVIQKYVVTLKKTADGSDVDNRGGENGSSGSSGGEDAKRLAGMLQDMGMTSALTKEDMSRGARGKQEYHSIVARQVADFLLPKLKTTGGILTMTDVFCLFNRARGTNLISPEDLVEAMELTKPLGLGISNRKFPSGIMVVQLDSFDDQVMAEKLLQLCNQQQQSSSSSSSTSSLTSLEASRLLHTSALLAHEHLLAAERAGYLCRDTTLETTRFFPNRFNDFTW